MTVISYMYIENGGVVMGTRVAYHHNNNSKVGH